MRKACIVILLDALDESDHQGKGFQPVMSLISERFKKLPSQVKFVLTSRVEQAECLKDWKPRLIKPDEQSNMSDMQILIKARVRASSLNATGRISLIHHDQAVKLILDRSKGQFIYAKYVFDYLKLRDEWSIEGLQTLPYGLGGAYELLMRIVDETLRRERPVLQKLLKDRLLPILAVASEPLSLSELHFASNHMQPPENYWPGWRPESQNPSQLHKNTFPDWRAYQRDSEPYAMKEVNTLLQLCLLYTSPSPRD